MEYVVAISIAIIGTIIIDKVFLSKAYVDGDDLHTIV